MSSILSYRKTTEPDFANAELIGRCYESALFYSDVLGDEVSGATEGIDFKEKLNHLVQVIQTIFANIAAAFKRFFDRLFSAGGVTMQEQAWQYGRAQCETLMDKAQKLASTIANDYANGRDVTDAQNDVNSQIAEIKKGMDETKNKVKSLAEANKDKTAYVTVNRGDYNKFLEDVKHTRDVLTETVKKELPSSKKDSGDAYESYYKTRAVQLSRLCSELSNFFTEISLICRKANKNTEKVGNTIAAGSGSKPALALPSGKEE
jgi:archaellum component FlaC